MNVVSATYLHYLCSQCYAAQHSYVPLLSIRRDSPSKITLIIAVLYGMASPNSLVRNFKNFKIALSELSLNLAMILVPDFFSPRLVGTIYRLEGLNKKLI